MPYSFLNLKYRVNLKPHLPPISYRVNKRIVKGKGKHGLSHARERMGNIWGLYNGIQKAWVLARKQLVQIFFCQHCIEWIPVRKFTTIDIISGKYSLSFLKLVFARILLYCKESIIDWKDLYVIKNTMDVIA